MNYGVMAIALSMIISTILSSFINAYPNSKILKYSYIDQIKDMMPSILLSLFMSIVIYPINVIINNSLLLIIVQVLIGGMIYVLLSRILKLESFMYIISMIKNMKNKKGI